MDDENTGSPYENSMDLGENQTLFLETPKWCEITPVIGIITAPVKPIYNQDISEGIFSFWREEIIGLLRGGVQAKGVP